MQVLKVSVKPQKDRLDQFVSTSIKILSRSKAKKLIEENFILVNSHPVEPSYKVSKGDEIRVEIPAPKSVSLKAENIPLKIVYEDKDILVIDKPAGIVVHPTLDHPGGTVVNALLNHLKNLSDETLRPGIVHRLDKDTSGLLIIAKNSESVEELKNQFKNRTVQKTYLALVHGRVEKEIGLINEPIDRHPKFRSKFIAGSEGREATTEYKVIERFKNSTLLSLKPLTGRTHQIRVHLAYLGHSIIGDKLYGGKMLLPRQFLHASRIEFNHPSSKERLSFQAPLASDLERFLEKTRKQYVV